MKERRGILKLFKAAQMIQLSCYNILCICIHSILILYSYRGFLIDINCELMYPHAFLWNFGFHLYIWEYIVVGDEDVHLTPCISNTALLH